MDTNGYFNCIRYRALLGFNFVRVAGLLLTIQHGTWTSNTIVINYLHIFCRPGTCGLYFQAPFHQSNVHMVAPEQKLKSPTK